MTQAFIYIKVRNFEYFRPFIDLIIIESFINDLNSNPIQLEDGFYVKVQLAMCVADLLVSHHLQGRI